MSSNPRACRTVVELTSTSIDNLHDRAPAASSRLGVFSSLGAANAWLRSFVGTGRQARRHERSVTRFTATELVLDCACRSRRTIVFDERADVVGELPRGVDRPWSGREPDNCRYQIGDIVAFVDDRVLRVGVVCALPPSPNEARRVGWVTRGDDVCRVGLVELHDDHAYEQVPEALLIPVPQHWVDDGHYEALQKRLAASRGPKGPALPSRLPASPVAASDAETHILVESSRSEGAGGVLTLSGDGTSTEWRRHVALPPGVLVGGHVRGPLHLPGIHEILSGWALTVPGTLQFERPVITDGTGLPFTVAIIGCGRLEGTFEMSAVLDAAGRPEILADVRRRGEDLEDEELESGAEDASTAQDDGAFDFDDDPRTCRSAVIVLGDESREPEPGPLKAFLTKRAIAKAINRRIRIDRLTVQVSSVSGHPDRLGVTARTASGERLAGMISIELAIWTDGKVGMNCLMRVEVETTPFGEPGGGTCVGIDWAVGRNER
jgi:hypothetical protein